MFEEGRQLLREWLNGLDQKLAVDAARARLSRHPTMTGNEREQIFREALREFVPPALHIGSGRVFDACGTPSRQVDVVVFDGRFPILKQGDSALYPVEGVIATVEIKSLLNDAELQRALDNCRSVMALSPSYVKEDAERLLKAQCARGVDLEQAREEMIWDLIPRTYIFAYDGMKTTHSLTDSLRRWLDKGVLGTQTHLFVPSVIVTGGAVGIAWGDPVKIRAIDQEAPTPRDEDVVMSSFQTDTRFGILASHLLWQIERRTTLVEHSAPIRRAFNAYLPFEEYINEVVREGPYALTVWTRPPADAGSDGRGTGAPDLLE